MQPNQTKTAFDEWWGVDPHNLADRVLVGDALKTLARLAFEAGWRAGDAGCEERIEERLQNERWEADERVGL